MTCFDEAGHDVDELTLAAAEPRAELEPRRPLKAIWNKEIADELADAHSDLQAGCRPRAHAVPSDVSRVFRAAHSSGVPTVTTLHSYRWSCVAAHLCT